MLIELFPIIMGLAQSRFTAHGKCLSNDIRKHINRFKCRFTAHGKCLSNWLRRRVQTHRVVSPLTVNAYRTLMASYHSLMCRFTAHGKCLSNYTILRPDLAVACKAVLCGPLWISVRKTDYLPGSTRVLTNCRVLYLG